MFLALKELRRAKGRFALVISAIALLVFLILFQQALQDALLRSFVGAIRNQTAPLLVYSVDGQKTLQGSVITPDLEQSVRGVDGVDSVGRINASEFSIRADDDLVDATIVGYEDAALGAPTDVTSGRLPRSEGEVVASDVDAPDGFDVGDVVTVEPGGFELRVVGLAAEAQLNVGPTMFGTSATYAAAVKARNPDAGSVLPNALGVAPADGVTPDELVQRINDADPNADALTREEAADSAPGVAQVQQSFRIIFVLYAVVVPCVTGLFFLIVTFQKAAALTLLRAVGAPAAALVRSLFLQVGIVVLAGFAIGAALFFPLSSGEIGGLPLRFDVATVLVWFTLVVVLALASAAVAARRVLRIDPATATGGQGVG